MARVLIVDDERELREAWAEALVEDGNTVKTAEDGVEAFKQLGAGVYDVILFDINLPRLNGLEAIKRIRRTEPDLPILVVTGQHDPATARAAIAAGATDALFKPVALNDLIEAVARLARQA